ncbi:MAG: Rid family hydrolase [Parabacteroides sp.]|nr:Rid family hydrolase [Parabacteroides sp.]
MTIIKKTVEQDTIQVQISSFEVQGGVTEYQVLISVTDFSLPFQAQLENLRKAYMNVVKEDLDGDAISVFRRYFVSDAANQTDAIMEWECENSYCALSIVQQAPLNGTKLALWTYLQTGVRTEVHKSGLLEVSRNGYRHLWLGGAYNKAVNSEYQTRLLMNDYVMQLMEQRCTLAANCVRTWFFVQNVDVNYAGVVKARKEVFITQGLTENTHYIASTGIEGRHADPSVLVQMDSYAVDGLEPGQIQYLYAPSHLNPTYEYGVTFERGTSVTYGDRKQVFISGTASIDNRGEIVYPGDIVKQTERMMENISVLLKEADATTRDITQAITYLRDMADYAVVKEYFEAHYPDLPQLIVLAPVCRPGWLIETECIAEVPAESSFKPL